MALRPLFELPRRGARSRSILDIIADEEIARGLALLEAEARGEEVSAREADPYDRLRTAIDEAREIVVPYRRTLDGHRGRYRLRPYELGFHPTSGRPVLWAQAAEGDGARPLHASNPSTGGLHTDIIHAFLEDGLDLDALRLTDDEFSPDWPLRPESVP